MVHLLSLNLLMLGIITDNTYFPFSENDFAFLTSLLYRRTYFHIISTPILKPLFGLLKVTQPLFESVYYSAPGQVVG